jgi:hypothetical protein
LYVAVALVAGAAAIFKLHALWRDPGNSATRYLCLTLIALAAALTVSITAPHALINRILEGNAARFVDNALTVAAAFGVQGVLNHLVHAPVLARRRMRRAVAAALGALGAMAALFVLAPVHRPVLDFAGAYGSEPLFVAYLLVYLGYLGSALAGILRLTSRYTRHAERTFLRLGLRLIEIGAGCGLLYVGYKGAYFVLLAFGHHTLGVESLVSTALAGAAALFVTIGATIPAWGQSLARTGRRLSQQHAYRRLRPLWADLTAVAPDITLTPVSTRLASLRLRDAGIQLYRRVIEIYDGRMVLRPYLDAAVAARAAAFAQDAGLAGSDAAAVVEAARLAAGIDAMKRDARATDEDLALPPAPGGTSLSAEAAWLIVVTRAYRRSPIVRAALKSTATASTGESAP